jgi:hypothetical protein
VHVQESLLLQKEVGLLEMVTRSVMKPLLETLLIIVRTSRPEITEKFVQGLLACFAAQDEAERAAAAARAQEPRASTDSASPCPETSSAPSANRGNGAPFVPPAAPRPLSRGQDGACQTSRPTMPPPKGNGDNRFRSGPRDRQRTSQSPGGWVPT